MKTEKYQQISSGLCVLVFCAAIISSSLLISGDQLGRVNLLYLLVLFVAWPVVSLVVAVFLSLFKAETGFVSSLLAIPIWPRTWLDALGQMKRHGLFKQWLVWQSQKLALVFSAGCLIAFVFVLLFNDVTFVWRSTLLNATQVLPVLEVIALPWFFIDSAQPLLSMVEASQDSRLSLSPQLVTANLWWQFIFMAQVIYALMPRCFLYFYTRNKFSTALESSNALLDQLDDPEYMLSGPSEIKLKQVSETKIDIGEYVLLNWGALPDPLMGQLSQLYGAPEKVFSLKDIASAEAELSVISDNRMKVLVVAAWEPPMGELEDFMQQTKGILLPLDWGQESFRCISPLHLDEWRRFCFSLSNWELQLPKELS